MSGEREESIQAAEKEAASIVEDGDATSNAVLSGGKTPARIDSETAHRMAAAIARDQDRGHVRPTAEYIREANRRR